MRIKSLLCCFKSSIIFMMVVSKRSRDHTIPLNSRYHFFDSRNGYSSVMLVKLPIFGFLVIILAK